MNSSYQIFYNEIYRIELGLPLGKQKRKKDYYKEAMNTLYDFFVENKDFYIYVRSCSTELDQLYFANSLENKSALMAQILANNEIEKFLHSRLGKMKEDAAIKSEEKIQGKYNWTAATKSDLAELIYGLHAMRTINNGQVPIKELAEFFGHAFGIDLSDIYDIYRDIKKRKKKQVIFLDAMSKILEEKMLNES